MIEKDKSIFFLSADFGAAALDELRERFPKNFLHWQNGFVQKSKRLELWQLPRPLERSAGVVLGSLQGGWHSA